MLSHSSALGHSKITMLNNLIYFRFHYDIYNQLPHLISYSESLIYSQKEFGLKNILILFSYLNSRFSFLKLKSKEWMKLKRPTFL